MANPLSAFGAYFTDCFKIFVLPVTTIRRAADRGLSIGNALIVLVLMMIVAGAVRYGVSLVPGSVSGGVSASLSATTVVLEEISTFLFFVISLLVLFALVIVFGGKTDFARLFCAKLSLASAIVGAFLIALIGKLIIGLLFFGATDGVAGGLLLMGEQFGAMAIGLILAVYTVIVARFGGQLSWLFAVIVGVLHFVLMVALYYAYNVVLVRNELSAIEQMLKG